MLQLTFTEPRPLNSTVVDSATGILAYEIRTPHTTRGFTTTVRNARGEVVATYDSSALRHALTLGGETKDLSEWLEREHTYSLARKMHAPDGRAYEWERDLHAWMVTDCETGKVIATSQSANRMDGTKFTVDVHQEGLPIVDALVTIFALLEARLRATPSM